MSRFAIAAVMLLSIASPSFAGSQQAVQEGNGGNTVITVAVTIPFPVNLPVTGTYQTVDGTATAADNDYVPASGTFTIPGGSTTSAPIAISVVGDSKVESNESFTLQFSVPNGAPPPPFSFLIINDDLPAIAVSNASVTEGNSGTSALTFIVSLTQAASVAVQVNYATADGTATAGSDYQPASGTLTFAPGQSSQPVNVTVNGDTLFEPNETLTLNATALAGNASASGTGTIVNDDAAPPATISIVSGNNQQIRPGLRLPQPLVVVVRNASGGPVAGASVQWRVVRGEAQLDPATSITNAAGQASTNVTILSAGVVEIEASIGNLAPVKFTINSATNFELRAEGPVAVPIARVLDGICTRNEPAFAAVCRALVALPDGQLTPALERIAPQQSGAQSKVASEVISTVTSGISARLSAVRGGVDRFSVQQLSLGLDGRSVPVGALTQLLMQDAPEESDYNGWSAFLSGNLGDGERIGRDGQLGFDLKSRGLMIGADRLFGDNVFGIAANFAQLDSELSDDAGSVDTSGFSLSVYGSRGGLFGGGATDAYDGMHVEGSVTVGRNTYDAEHVVDIAGLPLARATSENDADLLAIAGGFGFEAHRGRTDFDATLSGTWSRASIEDLTEEGSGPLILFVQGHEIESLTATLGINARSAFAVPFGALLPSIRAELVHEFKSDARLVTARFLRDTLGTSFTVPLDRPDANYGKLAAGLMAAFPYGVSAYIEVTQDVLRSDLDFRTVQFNLSKSF